MVFGRKSTVLLLGVPLAGVVLVIGAVALRRGVPPSGPPAARAAVVPAPLVLAPARSEPRPVPASEKSVGQESESARIRSTYQNYRTAVATRNAALEKALLPVLLRDRQEALRFAQEDLSRAPSPVDRDVTQKVVDALRR
jgi:hypothetical protein